MKARRTFALWQKAIPVTAMVAALAVASGLARPGTDRGAIAASASAPVASSSVTATAPAQSTSASPTAAIGQSPAQRPAVRGDADSSYNTATPRSIEDAGNGVVADVVDWRASVDQVAPSLGRFVVELKPSNASAPRPSPRFAAKLEPLTGANNASWLIRLELADAVWRQAPGEAFECCLAKTVNSGMIRSIAAGPLTANPPTGDAYRGVAFGIYLDDARPWRVGVLQSPLRLVVDIGGTPQATSDSIAVYSPRAGDTGRTFTISGFARTFEAHVVWRINDAAGREIARGFTTASIGTSAVWGSFQTTANIPANVSGNITLEVFWPSPKDGSDLGLVRIPLTVR